LQLYSSHLALGVFQLAGHLLGCINHLLEYCLFPTRRLNLGFITEGKLAAIFIKPSLGFSNWPVIYFINYTPTSFLAPSSPRHQQVFLAPLPGKKKTSARGVSHAHPLLCFKFYFTLFLLASFYQKHKKN
jgi:hypothetical protein